MNSPNAYLLHGSQLDEGNIVPLTMFVFMLAMVGNLESHKEQNVQLDVDVQSSVYHYTVSNKGNDPIIGFEMNEWKTYNFQVPTGWAIESHSKVLIAKSTNSSNEIKMFSKGNFSVRVSSQGATLGKTSIKLHLKSGNMITIPNVAAPVKEPSHYRIVIILTILAILIIHTVLKKKSAPNLPH